MNKATAAPGVSSKRVRYGQASSADGSHGRTTPLSRLGREQAQAVAAELAPEEAAPGTYTSLNPRAITTAQPFCDRYGIAPIIDKRLAKFDQRHAQRPAA
jgi:broad specificity phosphatase PhoE